MSLELVPTTIAGRTHGRTEKIVRWTRHWCHLLWCNWIRFGDEGRVRCRYLFDPCCPNTPSKTPCETHWPNLETNSDRPVWAKAWRILPALRANWLMVTFRTRVPSVAVNLNLQYGFRLGNENTYKGRSWGQPAEAESDVSTLNCSSEQIRTLCEGTELDEVGETLSEVVVAGREMLGTIVGDSTVGIPEPCPIDWFEPSRTTMLKTGALCFKRISLATREGHDDNAEEKMSTDPWYMYKSDLWRSLLHS